MNEMIKKRDFLLLVISAARESALTPVQLQKSVFLLGQKFKNSLGHDFYEFIPHLYGPFSRGINEDLTFLKANELIKIIQIPGKPYNEYQITAKGSEHSEDRMRRIPKEIIDYVFNLIPQIQKLSFEKLISAIYAKFPDYKVNSVFRG